MSERSIGGMEGDNRDIEEAEGGSEISICAPIADPLHVSQNRDGVLSLNVR